MHIFNVKTNSSNYISSLAWYTNKNLYITKKREIRTERKEEDIHGGGVILNMWKQRAKVHLQ